MNKAVVKRIIEHSETIRGTKAFQTSPFYDWLDVSLASQTLCSEGILSDKDLEFIRLWGKYPDDELTRLFNYTYPEIHKNKNRIAGAIANRMRQKVV